MSEDWVWNQAMAMQSSNSDVWKWHNLAMLRHWDSRYVGLVHGS